MNAKDFINHFRLDVIFSNSLFGWCTEDEAVNILVSTNFNFLQFFMYTSLMLNFFYSLDLMLTLKSPFYPHERRMKWYTFLAPFIATILVALTSDNTTSYIHVLNFYTETLTGCVVITAYLLFSIFSCAYNYRLGFKAGMSSEIRQQCIYRHILYVIVYQCTWLPYLAITYYGLFLACKHENLGNLYALKGT